MTQRPFSLNRRALAGALGALAAEGAPARPALLVALRGELQSGQEDIRRRFEPGAMNGEGGPGLALAHEMARLMDALTGALLDYTTQHVYPAMNPTAGERLCALAVGGYGRGELAPFSDIDLLFLSPYKQTPWGEQVVEYTLYALWDLGLRVGHATRSVDESIRLARTDHAIRTTLLEARPIWGDRRLFGSLSGRLAREVIANGGADFIEAKLNERDARHLRFGDSRYVIEPNVKDGKGGLRDLHTLLWIARHCFGIRAVADLVPRQILSPREYRSFRRALSFLWTVRCHLHYLAGRAEERLTVDLQPEIGRRLGYADRRGSRGVERFMKYYFLVAKDVGDLTRVFCAALEDAHRRRPRLADPQAPAVPAEAEGFLIEGGRIRLLQPEVFAERPVAMIGLFHLADRLALDIHPEVLRALAGRLGGIDQRLRADPQANRLFLEILTSRHKPETALRRMNESGVLGRFVPEFGRVIAQMQYDMYHVYTVDEHAIRAIGLLSRIEKGELAADHPLSDAVVHKVLSRRALYLGLFLHDIGKGRGVDHSEFGATVALKLGPRLGLSAEETETAAWLVRHHLSFSHTAFKRDISDPKTVEDFVALVQSPERLRLLLVLTVADIRAVGPGRWNGWKGQLLRDLYHAAEAMLSGGLAASGRARRVEEAHAALRERMADWPEAAVRAHAARCEDAYWLSADADTHARHARFIARAEERQAPVAIDTRIDRFRAITEVTLFAPDQVGLFARATGALTLSGATIVDAKIFTTIDGMALDTFLIQGAGGGSIDEPAKLARLREAIARALTGPLTLDRPLPLAPRLKSRTEVFTVAPRVLIDNGASHLHTVVEVNGRDRPGLLFDLARALTGLRLSIASAHIATFGERAVDVFYVKDRFGLKVTKEDALVAIRERLLEALAPPPPSPRARISGRPAPPLAVPGGAPSTR